MSNITKCKKCGTDIKDTYDFCSICGEPTVQLNTADINASTFNKSEPQKTETLIDDTKNTFFKGSKLKEYMKYCFIASAVFLCIGLFKRFIYVNPEYSWETGINAYVGGDAYNIIINGIYAAGYYILSVGFLISGIICGCANEIINTLSNPKNN